MKIEPAKRIQQIEEYYFSKKLSEVNKLKEQGKNIINIGIGNPDIATHPSVLDKLVQSSFQEGSNGYQSYRGIPKLRKSFSTWYSKTFDVDLDPETEILPLMGSKEGIMHISMAFTNPGDQVLIPNPGYPAYASVAKLLDLNIQYYNLQEQNNWLPDIPELNKLARLNCKILWLNYPHMPSGANGNIDKFKQLVHWAKSRNILIVNDNPYSLILNDKPISIFSATDNKSSIIELNSLSKSHNMAGWRIGMLASDKKNINHILKVKSNFDSGMYKPLQEAATIALQLPDSWYSKLNTIYTNRRELIWQMLDILNCSYDKNTAGLFVWAKVPSKYKNGEELSDFLLYSKSIFVAPGFIFGSNGDQYIRVSLCVNENILMNAISRLSNPKIKVA